MGKMYNYVSKKYVIKKQIFTIFAAVLLTAIIANAQTPEKMSYQAVVRDANNDLVNGIQIGMQISIMQTSANGTAVYVETQMPTTNANGLATVEIGGGTVVSGNFSTIDWSAGPYFIKTETDVDNDGTYDITGTSQLLSVPYALYAKTAGDVTETDLGDILTNGNDGNGVQIKNIANPTDAQDAATKAYVDEVKQMVLQLQAENGVTDIDGNHYNAVLIGNQVWMSEDLKVTHYPNGNPIPIITDDTAWTNLADNNTDDAYCFYDNNSGTDYGALYTYAAAIADNWTRDNTTSQGGCPDGWHLPTEVEWSVLTAYLGGENVAGGKMKEIGTIHWNSPNTEADNSSGFSALPGGIRNNYYGTSLYLGNDGSWWCSTENSSTKTYRYSLKYNSANEYRYAYLKSDGSSVRCVKD